ncbi:MAG: zinc-ribbon domain-containing protein [Proteobacteria bacterium]|nr:zinc-ribbon domain-containing protein [Pseudomonadota bacterium]
MLEKLSQKYINFKIKRLRKNRKLYESNLKLRDGCVLANHEKLKHIWLCVGNLPEYYTDMPFKCRDCGSKEVWTAVQQKYYFEELKGKHLEALAIRCRKCRGLKNLKKKKQQKHMQEMSEKEPHPNELFFKNIDEFKK